MERPTTAPVPRARLPLLARMLTLPWTRGATREGLVEKRPILDFVTHAVLILGLAVSIPIVVWGSTLILGWIERFPALLYLGGAVLAWTAAKMILGEPLVEERLEHQPALRAAAYVLVIGGVLAAAALRKRKELFE